MKYIKKFNEGEKDDYYIEISSSNRAEIDNSHNKYLEISKQSINYILKLFPDIKRRDGEFGNDGYTYKLPKISHSSNNNYICIYLNNSNLMYIIEMEDEWFIVSINIIHTYTTTKYKCDQLDGIKELLIDKGIIKE